MSTPLLEHMQPNDVVFGYDYNRIADALSGLRDGIITITDPGGNTTVNGGQVQPVGLGGQGTAVPSTPTLLTPFVSGLDRISQANNAYIIAAWQANATTDYVADYEVHYYNKAATTAQLTGTIAAVPVDSVPYNLGSGSTITLDDGAGNTQDLVLSGNVAAGATSIPVNSITLTHTFAAATMCLFGHGVARTGLTSVKIHNLFPGLAYYFKIRAQNNLGNFSGYATVLVPIGVDTTPPAVPAGLTAYSAPHGAFVKWNANTDADLQGYFLQVSTDGGVTWTAAQPGPDLRTSVEWVNPSAPNNGTSNIAVEFRVSAVDWSNNQSAWTAPASATTGGLSFSELLVGNITAIGTITSGAFQTGTAGAHMVFDNNGMRGFATDGTTKTLEYSTATGNVTITGNVAVGGTTSSATITAATIQIPAGAGQGTPPGQGVVIDGTGISFYGTVNGTNTKTWSALTSGQFISAQYYPVYSGYYPVDATYPLRLNFEVTPDVIKIVKVTISFYIDSFKVGQQTTAAANTSAGGSSHTHSASDNHSHGMPQWGQSAAALTGATAGWNADGLTTASSDGVGHPIPGTITTSGFTINTAESSHTHGIPSLSLNAPTQLYTTGGATGVHVKIYNQAGTLIADLSNAGWTGSGTFVSDVDITSYITTTGWWQILITSATLGGIEAQVNMKVILQAI